MKSIIFSISAMVLLYLPCPVPAQSILAGQAEGKNIVYNDVDDISISSPFWNTTDNEYLDIDGDDSDDLYLSTFFYYYSHLDEMSSGADAVALGEMEYSVLPENTEWIRKHPAGDLIGHDLLWSSVPALFRSVYSSKSEAGSFMGEGYMAFRICEADTMYGWIRLNINVGFDGAYITVYDYAYVTNYTSVSHLDNIQNDAHIWIAGGELMVNLCENHQSQSLKLECYDLSGKLIFNSMVFSGLTLMDISAYDNGIYILRLSAGTGKNFITKLIF